MRINTGAVLTTLDGVEMKGPDGLRSATVGLVIVDALLFDFKDETPDGNEKMRRYKLATAIHGSTEADLSAEDIALIKLLVGKVFGPLIVGQVFTVLEEGVFPAAVAQITQ